MLRNVISWGHVQGHGNKKIVIFEFAEELQDSSANLLLKILEEPPENVFFIFITTRTSAILPTILSRIWVEKFSQRSLEEEKRVMKKVFRDEEAGLRAKRLSEFLTHFKKNKNTTIDISQQAELYFTASVENKPFKDEFLAFLKEGTNKQVVRDFLQSLQ